RAYTVMKRATEQNIIKKRDKWMGGDQNVLTLLRFPLRGSHENFLQEDALNLSYRYIDRKIEDPKLQAKSFERLAKDVVKTQPEEAAYIGQKAALAEREAHLKEAFTNFLKTGQEMD